MWISTCGSVDLTLTVPLSLLLSQRWHSWWFTYYSCISRHRLMMLSVRIHFTSCNDDNWGTCITIHFAYTLIVMIISLIHSVLTQSLLSLLFHCFIHMNVLNQHYSDVWVSLSFIVITTTSLCAWMMTIVNLTFTFISFSYCTSLSLLVLWYQN